MNVPGFRLFISHSSEDMVWCRPFVAALRTAGYTCFFDEDSISGTTAWVTTIEREVQACDLFVLILSPSSLTSPWVQDERQLAYAKRKPFLTIQHIPTPEIDGFLAIRQWINVMGLEPVAAAQRALNEMVRLGLATEATPPTLTRTTRAIPAQAFPIPTHLAQLGFVAAIMHGVEVIVPPVCNVPMGNFTMGSDRGKDPQAHANQIPQYDIYVPAFHIAIFPLTVAEYACAVKARALAEPQSHATVTWSFQRQRQEHPVVCISWYQARDYAAWLASVTDQPWRLSTEAEWEKAARGNDGRIYPWGNEWDRTKANTAEGGPGMTTPIGTFAEKGDTSPFGAHDLAGNVWEWTSSIYHREPPYRAEQAENDADETSSRVFRGGSWHDLPTGAHAAFRGNNTPDLINQTIGTRLVRGRA